MFALADEVAVRVTEKHLQRHPEMLLRFGEIARVRCLEDARFHLQYLRHAIELAAPELFVGYAQWARQLLEKRGIGWRDLQENLELLRDEAMRELDAGDAARVHDVIDAALRSEPAEAPPFLPDTPREPLARAYLTALLRANRRHAADVVHGAARDGVPIRDLYLHVFQPVQREVGRLWQDNEISVAEEHFCTAATQAIIAGFYPQIVATPRVGRKVVVACVGDELHEMGTRMVADFFEMEGWDGIYLGANTPARALIELVCRERPHLVALGVTMTYHLLTASKLIASVRADERCGNVKVMAGGYVLVRHPEMWRTIGADGSAPDAAAAVVVGKQLVDER